MDKDRIIAAIHALFADRSRSAGKTLSDMMEIEEAARMNIDALRDDGVEAE